MNGRSALAIAICVVCFAMGYLFYVAAVMIGDFFIAKATPCRTAVAVCSEAPAR